MATNLLTSTEIAYFTGILGDHYKTFSYHNLIVHKEALKTLVSNPVSPLYGYGNDSTPNSYTYTTVTGQFLVMISPKLPSTNKELEEIKASIETQTVRIKVDHDAHNFIEDGRKNEKFEFDGQTFNAISSDGVLGFLGLKYYVYNLERTN